MAVRLDLSISHREMLKSRSTAFNVYNIRRENCLYVGGGTVVMVVVDVYIRMMGEGKVDGEHANKFEGGLIALRSDSLQIYTVVFMYLRGASYICMGGDCGGGGGGGGGGATQKRGKKNNCRANILRPPFDPARSSGSNGGLEIFVRQLVKKPRSAAKSRKCAFLSSPPSTRMALTASTV